MEPEKDILKKHITRNFNQEVPSFDFTETVIQKIEDSLEVKTVIAPLIPKKIWVISAAIGFVVILASFGIETQLTKPEWIKNIGFDLPKFENYKATIQIAVVIFIIFLLMTLVDIIYRRKNTYQHKR